MYLSEEEPVPHHELIVVPLKHNQAGLSFDTPIILYTLEMWPEMELHHESMKIQLVTDLLGTQLAPP